MDRRLSALGIAALLSISLVACGSSDADSDSGASSGSAATNGGGSATSGVSEAAEFLKTVEAAPTTIGIDAPLSRKPDAGKTIVTLTNGGAANIAIDAGMTAAADVLGWTVKEIDTGHTPETMQAAMDQAIQLKPDGITYSGIPTAVLSKQLDAAEAAGIPVVATAITDPPSGPMIDSTLANADQSEAFGQAVAAYVVAESGGKANIGLVTLPAYPILTTFDEAFKAAVEQWCPDCSISEIPQQLADIGTKTPASIVSQLQRSPDTDWLVFDLGDVATGVAPALRAANLEDVNIVGSVPAAANLAAIDAGTEGGWMAYPVPVIGMRIIDDFARQFNGDDLAAVQSELLPSVMVTADNLGSLELASDGTYPGPTGAIDQFKTLWKIS